MELRELLIRELSRLGIYQARKMSIEEMLILLTEIKRTDEVMKSDVISTKRYETRTYN